MEYKDYYKTLGVAKGADDKDIKKAYRRLARQYHPDVNPGDKAAEARFKEINEAHAVLSDQEKRRKYDELGQNYQRWQQAGGGPAGFDWSRWAAGGPAGGRVQYGNVQDLQDLFGGSGFSDFFETLFGGMGVRTAQGRQAPPCTRDLEQEVEITLEEAFRGAQRLMELDGRRLEVKIPPGVKTGSRVRMAGEGLPVGAGQSGPRGDLYLRIKVSPHHTFERRDDDLYCEAAVDLFAALLGGEVRAPSLGEGVALRIPAGTQTGRTFRLAGQGMPRLRAPQERGDLYVKVRVMLPDRLTEREQKLVREWAAIRGAAS
jgi:curved DNA-binding protein